MDSNLPIINIDITEEEHTLPLVFQDLSPYDSIYMDRPIHLNDFITRFKNNQNYFVEQQIHIDMEFLLLDKDFLFSSK